jgi:hypothetical protein
MNKQRTGDKDINWFGADVEENKDKNRTAVYIDGFKGVDADVIRPVRMDDGTVQDIAVRRPAPNIIMAKTTAGIRTGHDIGKLTARYKTFREAARFAPLDDREMWETRRDIALCEMQIARFQQKLERYQERSDARPEQIRLIKDTINRYRGQWMELTKQA